MTATATTTGKATASSTVICPAWLAQAFRARFFTPMPSPPATSPQTERRALARLSTSPPAASTTAGGKVMVMGTETPPTGNSITASSMVPLLSASSSSTASSTLSTTDENRSVVVLGKASACLFTARKRTANAPSSAAATCWVFTTTGLSASSFAGWSPKAPTHEPNASAAQVPRPLALARGRPSSACATPVSTACCPSA